MNALPTLHILRSPGRFHVKDNPLKHTQADDAAPPAAGADDPRPAATNARWVFSLLLIAALAFGLRLVWLRSLTHSVLAVSMHADAEAYWNWATYLRQHDMLGSNPFFLGPLYPYVLAVLRTLFSDSIPLVLLLQAVCGSVAVALIADAARRLISPLVGAAIGILVAGYQMAVFFDGLLLMESFLFFLQSLLLWTVVRRAHSWRRRDCVLLGALVGLLVNGRALFVVMLLPLGWLLSSHTAPRRGFLPRLAAFLGTFILTIAPATVYNRLASGEWIPITYNFGYNFFVGFNPEATGSFVFPTNGSDPVDAALIHEDGGIALDGRSYLKSLTGRTFSAGASSQYWASRAWKYVMAHPSAAAALALRKIAMFWNWREYPQIESLELYQAVCGRAGIPILGIFAVVGPLAIAGMAIAFRRGMRGVFLIAHIWLLTLSIVPFFVVDRYRIHVVPAAALLAGLALERLAGLWRSFSIHRAITILSPLLLGGVLVGLPLPARDPTRVAWDNSRALGILYLERGDLHQGMAHLRRAVEIDDGGTLHFPGTSAAGVARASVYAAYGIALRDTGDFEGSLLAFQTASGLAPHSESVGLGLAEAYGLAGRPRDAYALYARLGVSPRAAAGLLAYGARAASERGQLAAVEGYLRAALIIDPTNQNAWMPLVRLYVGQRRYADAYELLQHVKENTTDQRWWTHHAYVAVEQGSYLEAANSFVKVSPESAGRDSAIRNIYRYVAG